jgi:uncharacterized membrane protein
VIEKLKRLDKEVIVKKEDKSKIIKCESVKRNTLSNEVTSSM